MQPELASEPECLRAISEWLPAIHNSFPNVRSLPSPAQTMSVVTKRFSSPTPTSCAAWPAHCRHMKGATMSMSARQQLMLAPRLTSSEMDRCANKEGQRRTIYFTKKLPGDAGYRRTGQYLGEWQDNKWSGNGTHEMANGNRYVGAWAEGKRHGMGTLWVKRKGGLRKQYAGQWQDDLQHGRGVFHYTNGDNYNGEWKGGVRHGVGIMTYITGDVYEGEWFNDQRHGFGVLDLVKGDHFEGMWVEDKKEGEGVHFYFNKEKATHTRRYDAEWPRTHHAYHAHTLRTHRVYHAHTLHMPSTCPAYAYTHHAHTMHAPSRYDGEWVDNVPKCGFYSEMPPDPMVRYLVITL